jgi:hypothetical protein
LRTLSLAFARLARRLLLLFFTTASGFLALYIRIRSVTVMAESHRRSMELASEMYLVMTASCRRRRYSLAASRSGRPPSGPPAAPASGSGRGSGCTARRHATAAISHPCTVVMETDVDGSVAGSGQWQENLDVVLDVGLEVEQDPRGLGGPLPPHVPRQDACTCGPKWPMR